MVNISYIMSTLVRFFNDQTLVCGLVFNEVDTGCDLLKWLCGHHCFGGIEHLACIYRLYARFKYKLNVMTLQEAITKRTVIRLKYDMFIKDKTILVKARDYATGVKVKGNPHQLLQYLYGKN